MSWADYYIKDLSEGKAVQFRPSGNSMIGKINNKELVTVEPLNQEPKVGDIVLCKVKGNQYLHLVKAIKKDKDKISYQIGNNKGGINGWIKVSSIYGVVTKVEK